LAYSNLALVYIDAGHGPDDWNTAARLLRAAVAADPSLLAARSNLAKVEALLRRRTDTPMSGTSSPGTPALAEGGGGGGGSGVAPMQI
jgi:hypothetical protein